MTAQRYSAIDYGVFGVTTAISLAIGIYHAFSGGRQRTTSEYLVGGRSMNYFPVAISLLVSFESSIMMLGVPAEMYVYGVQRLWLPFGVMVATLLSINVLIPLLHPLKLTSAYEFLEYRFQCRALRVFGTILGILHGIWYMGVVLFGPAIALKAVAGFPLWGSILGISIVAIIYTSLGGLKAVIWTDVFQCSIMFIGMFSVLIKGTIDAGGPKQAWDIAKRGGRFNFFNFDPSPVTRSTFWNLLSSGLIHGLSFCFHQSTVQRISAISSQTDAKRLFMIVAPICLLIQIMAASEGILAYVFYENRKCDPLKSDQLTDPNQLLPLTVMDMFSFLPGMPGIFLASLFSASLSTLSSMLSAISALFWADIAHPIVGNISDVKATLIAKLTVPVCGALSCAVAFAIAEIGGTLPQITDSILSAFTGPLSGVFFLGAFVPRANAKGALIGGIISLIASLWLSFGMNFSPAIKEWPWLPSASTEMCHLYTNITVDFASNTSSSGITTTSQLEVVDGPEGVEHLYTLSFTLLGVLGFVASVLLGMLGSLLTGMNKPGDVDPRYIVPITDTLLVWLPKRCRQALSAIGPQFMDEKYKARFQDPSLIGDNRVYTLVVLSKDDDSPDSIAKRSVKDNAQENGL